MAALPPNKPLVGWYVDDHAPPAPMRCMAGIAYLVPRKTPVALTSIIRRHPFVSIGSATDVLLSPALFTRMSSFPNRVTVVWTALSQMTENRKVWIRKSLIFQYTVFGFCLEKAILRQS